MMMSEKADGDVLEMFSFDDVSRCGAVVLSAVTFCKKRERGREGRTKETFQTSSTLCMIRMLRAILPFDRSYYTLVRSVVAMS